MDLELAWLKSWLAVIDAGGFARAADRIYLSQPRVSAHVANLERASATRLSIAKRAHLTLTDEGQRFLPRARAILAAVDDAVAELRSTETSTTGRVTLASFASASSEFLPSVISAIRNDHPGIQVGVLDLDVLWIDAVLAGAPRRSGASALSTRTGRPLARATRSLERTLRDPRSTGARATPERRESSSSRSRPIR